MVRAAAVAQPPTDFVHASLHGPRKHASTALPVVDGCDVVHASSHAFVPHFEMQSISATHDGSLVHAFHGWGHVESTHALHASGDAVDSAAASVGVPSGPPSLVSMGETFPAQARGTRRATAMERK